MSDSNGNGLARFADQPTVLLTTFRRDGTPVGTPVSIAVEEDHAFVRTYDRAWKAIRIRNNPNVEVAPSTVGGRQTGPGVKARARLLDGTEAKHAAKLLAGKNKILQGVLVPAFHRLKRYQTLHYELTTRDG